MKFLLHVAESIEFIVIQTSFLFSFVSLDVIYFLVYKVRMQVLPDGIREKCVSSSFLYGLGSLMLA